MRRKPSRSKFIFQSINDTSIDDFRNKIISTDWSEVFAESTADKAYDTFMTIFSAHYKACFKLKSVRQRRSIRKPWIGIEQVKMIEDKNKLFALFLKTRKPSILAEFKKLRNRITSELRKAKVQYFQQLIQDASTSRPDRIWKIVNDALGLRTAAPNQFQMTVQGQLLTEGALAEHFNTHYITAMTNNAAPSVTSCVLDDNLLNTVFMVPTNTAEVYNIFTSLKNSKSLDIDNIQVRPVKYVLDVICPALVHIYNLALEAGFFPLNMKRAKVSVIYKGGDKNDAANYRPVSVLPVFSKGLEKVILSRLDPFFTKHKLLSECQHGFRKGCSTESALLIQKELILKNMDANKLTLGVFVDYSKAFDCLNHTVLLNKLYHYGIRGVPHSLLKSYLATRMQSVVIDGSLSSFKEIPCGVPQGSVLGPFLFNIYVNDVVRIDKHVKFVLYADDTSLFFTSDNSSHLLHTANETLCKLLDWSSKNYLRINPKKSKAILFASKNKPVSLIGELRLGSSTIDIVKEHKVLGVVLSHRMTWDAHIQQLVKKLSSAVGLIRRSRDIFPTNIKLQVFHSVFRSHINYCTLIWATTTKKNITILHRLEKKAVRCIANVSYFHNTHDLITQFKLVSIQQIYDYRLLYLLYFSSVSYQQFLKELCTLTLQTRTYRTRSSEEWFVPRPRTNYLLQTLTYNVPFLLNKIKTQFSGSIALTRTALRSMFVSGQFSKTVL